MVGPFGHKFRQTSPVVGSYRAGAIDRKESEGLRPLQRQGLEPFAFLSLNRPLDTKTPRPGLGCWFPEVGGRSEAQAQAATAIRTIRENTPEAAQHQERRRGEHRWRAQRRGHPRLWCSGEENV